MKRSDAEALARRAIRKSEGVSTTISGPKNSCRRCHGTGVDGYDSRTKQPILCRCIYRNRRS